MRAVSFQSVTAYLLDDDPDWRDGVSLSAEIPTRQELGLTQRETRRAVGDTLRLSLSWTAVIEGAALVALRNALQALSTERVLCPLWPAYFESGGSPPVTTAFYVLMGDAAAPEIRPHSDLPFARPAYPMLVGRLESAPDPSLYHDEAASASFAFIEDDSWTITPPAFSLPDGLTAVGTMRPLWPFRADWASLPTSGSAERTIERQTIGAGRAPAEGYFTQDARRGLRQSFTLADAEPWQLLSALVTLAGSKATCWVAAGLADTRLAADVAAVDTSLTVASVTARGSNTAFLLDNLVNRVAVRVTGNVSSTWTLSGAVGTAFTRASGTRLESLVLARLKTGAVELRFRDLTFAEASLQFVECPAEDQTLSGETPGTTHGALPVTAWIYTFTIPFPGASQIWRYTSFERDLTYLGNTWTAAPIEHGDITERLGLERQSVRLKARYSVGHPFSLLLPMQLEYPLQVEIAEVDISASAVSALRVFFRGEVTEASYNGPFISAQARALSSLFDRQVPRLIIQPACNWAVFEPGCGLVLESWEFAALGSSWTLATRALVIGTISGPAVTITADYFAGGYVVIGTGSTQQVRLVAASSTVSGGLMTLTLGTAITFSAGAAVKFYPGCDGRLATCVDKFNNRARFSGFPYLPAGNPSITLVKKDASNGGGKK